MAKVSATLTGLKGVEMRLLVIVPLVHWSGPSKTQVDLTDNSRFRQV